MKKKLGNSIDDLIGAIQATDHVVAKKGWLPEPKPQESEAKPLLALPEPTKTTTVNNSIYINSKLVPAPKVVHISHLHGYFTNMVVFDTPELWMYALAATPKPLPRRTLWLYWNAASGEFKNIYEVRLNCYAIRKYTDFDRRVIAPGEQFYWKATAHMIVCRPQPKKKIKNFSFLSDLLPVLPVF